MSRYRIKYRYIPKQQVYTIHTDTEYVTYSVSLRETSFPLLLQLTILLEIIHTYFAKLLNVVARQETLNRCRGASVGRVTSYFFGIFRVKFVEILQNLRFFFFFFEVYLLGIPIQKLSSSNPWKDNVLKSWIVTLKVHTWCVNLNFKHTWHML